MGPLKMSWSIPGPIHLPSSALEPGREYFVRFQSPDIALMRGSEKPEDEVLWVLVGLEAGKPTIRVSKAELRDARNLTFATGDSPQSGVIKAEWSAKGAILPWSSSSSHDAANDGVMGLEGNVWTLVHVDTLLDGEVMHDLFFREENKNERGSRFFIAADTNLLRGEFYLEDGWIEDPALLSTLMPVTNHRQVPQH